MQLYNFLLMPSHYDIFHSQIKIEMKTTLLQCYSLLPTVKNTHDVYHQTFLNSKQNYPEATLYSRAEPITRQH